MLKGFENGQKFLIMSVIIEFCGVEGAGMESDWMDFSIRGVDRENGGKSVVGGISLKDHFCIGYPLSKYWCMSELFL
jgi:hypothetical protein